MMRIILHSKIKRKLKISLWTNLFYILPSYKKIKDTQETRYVYMWLMVGIVIQVPK